MMYPREMKRLLLGLFPLFLLLFITQTDAKFFIEVTDKFVNGVRVRLYECDDGAPTSLRDSASGRLPSPTTSPKKKHEDLYCHEVIDQKQKEETYTNANFHLVTNARPHGGRRFALVGKAPTSLRFAPTWTLIGVTLLGDQDYPSLSEKLGAVDLLRSKCKASHLTGTFLESKDVEDFVLYLSVANFRTIAYPTDEMIARYRLFNEVLKKVGELYANDVLQTGQKKVNKPKQKDALGRIGSAVWLLVQKLVDPCRFMSMPGEMANFSKRFEAMKEAATFCHTYCKILEIGFSVHRIESPTCGGSLVKGDCSNVCKCEWEQRRIKTSMRKTRRVELVTVHGSMMKCGNELRIAIAGVGFGSFKAGSKGSFQRTSS